MFVASVVGDVSPEIHPSLQFKVLRRFPALVRHFNDAGFGLELSVALFFESVNGFFALSNVDWRADPDGQFHVVSVKILKPNKNRTEFFRKNRSTVVLTVIT